VGGGGDGVGGGGEGLGGNRVGGGGDGVGGCDGKGYGEKGCGESDPNWTVTLWRTLTS